MNDDNLLFPSGLTVCQVKKAAKKLRKSTKGLKHLQALRICAKENGLDAEWNKVILALKLAKRDPRLLNSITVKKRNSVKDPNKALKKDRASTRSYSIGKRLTRDDSNSSNRTELSINPALASLYQNHLNTMSANTKRSALR